MVLGAVLGDLHEGLFQRCVGGGELVHGQVSPPGGRADLGGGGAGDTQQVRSVVDHRDAGGGEQLAQAHGFGGADHDGRGGGAVHEVLDGGLGDELAAAEHDELGGGLGHLAHQVGGHQDGAAFGGQGLEQFPDP